MLVSRKHKKLVLNLKDPDRVTSVIPGAKIIDYKGHPLVAVNHGLEETKVLRNLGMDAPSPINFHYDWPGRYKPYAHQQVTSEFLTMNPRAFCNNGMGCIAGDEIVRVSRKGKSFETKLRDLHSKFHSLPDKDSWKVRSLMGSRFGMNRLVDSLYKGEQATLRFTLEDGKTFRCTPDHRIARPDGSWSEAGSLSVGDSLVTNGRVMLTCFKCGKAREVDKYYATTAIRRGHACNECRHAEHRQKITGEKNPSWIGGQFVDGDGYVRKLAHGHHRADKKGYVYEHILVAEAAYGFPITTDYHVHHINENKTDNRIENLEVLTVSEHHKRHDSRVHLDDTISAKGGRVVVFPKESPIISIEDGGTTDVYDLCMESPHNNFVINGVVVHNSGKTVSVLWAFDYLRKAGVVSKMLVISPLSTLERAWGDEIFRNFPEMSFAVLHGTREKRHKLLANDFDIYIINHDGIKAPETVKALVEREGLDLVVIDEIASFRNASTDRWKALNTLVNGNLKAGLPEKEWVWGLTGTPIPNAPTDAWAQIRLINPTKVPRYFGQFRDTVMKPVGQFRWIPRENAVEYVHGVMTPAIRFAREDCIDLPPTTYVTRQTELTPEQKKAFDEMLRKFHTECESGSITAVNEAVKMSKLIQILCGVAYGANGEEVVIPAKPRIELVREIIDESSSKVLVFVPLTAALEVVAEELSKSFSVAVVHGKTSKHQRDEIFSAFQQQADPRVIVANPGTLQHGLTLTAASTVIWFAPIHSNESWQQANARVTRPGQKRNTLIVSIEATPLERKIYDRLAGKQKMQGLLLDLLKEG